MEQQKQEDKKPQSREELMDQMMVEILKNTRSTKNYIKWQFIITIALVVLPLLAMVFVIPFVFKSLGSAYGVGDSSSALKGLLQ